MFSKTFVLTTILSTAIAAPSVFPRQTAPEAWTIHNFTRDCTDANACNYKFHIDTNIGIAPAACTVDDTGSPATTHSFYDVACKETAEYHISWGYNVPSDFAVMTVVNETSQLEAYFGYDHPNAGNPVSNYTDAGPDGISHT